MTPSELLIKRCKVIALWPNTYYKVGDIITDDGGGWMKNEVPKYPHLFKPLHWSEDREAKDMPEYVKKGSMVYRVADAKERYLDCFMADYPMTEHWVQYSECLPSTKEEYIKFLNTQL